MIENPFLMSEDAFNEKKEEIIAEFGVLDDANLVDCTGQFRRLAWRDVARWSFWATVGVLSWCALTYIAVVSDLSGLPDRLAFFFFLAVSMRADRKVTQLDDLAASAIKFLRRTR